MQKSPRAQNNNALGRLNVFPHNLTWFLQSHLREDKSGNDGGHFFIFNEKNEKTKSLFLRCKTITNCKKRGQGTNTMFHPQQRFFICLNNSFLEKVLTSSLHDLDDFLTWFVDLFTRFEVILTRLTKALHHATHTAHSSHAAHTTHASHSSGGRVLLDLGDDGLGGRQ